MEEKVSIIIPVYNVRKYLNRCITSVILQSYKNIEIILIDDGSTDGSSNICRKWEKKDKRILYINIENKGVSHARNLGLKIAKGEYIMFIDSDDYIDKQMVQKMIDQAIKKKSDIVVSNFYYSYENNENVEIKDRLKLNDEKIDKYIKNVCDEKKFGGYCWNKMYKANIIKENNVQFHINIKIMEDLIFNLELFKHISNIGIINEPLYYYRQRDDSSLKRQKKFNVFEEYTIIIDILNEYNHNYANDYKLKYVLELEKAKIINDKQIIIRNNCYDKYYNYKLFFRHGKLKIKFKILMLKIFPCIYIIKKYLNIKEKVKKYEKDSNNNIS